MSDAGSIYPAPTVPLDVARQVIEELYLDGPTPTLRHWRGSFYRWTGPRWIEVPDADLSADLYRHLEAFRKPLRLLIRSRW